MTTFDRADVKARDAQDHDMTDRAAFAQTLVDRRDCLTEIDKLTTERQRVHEAVSVLYSESPWVRLAGRDAAVETLRQWLSESEPSALVEEMRRQDQERAELASQVERLREALEKIRALHHEAALALPASSALEAHDADVRRQERERVKAFFGEVIHQCPPDGSGLMPCCGRTPFEVPQSNRITLDPTMVTCALLSDSPVTRYHPDPEINAEVQQDAIEAEAADLAAGYPNRWWVCPSCGHSHNRGYIDGIRRHRCLNCGYVGIEGTMHTNRPDSPVTPKEGAE
jgi:hypothetical protein